MFHQATLYILLSTLFFSVTHALVKFLDHIPALQIIFFRALISLILSALAIYKMRINPWGKNKGGLILRGLFGAMALSMYFYTLQVMPLGTAVTLQQLSPIFAVIFATFVLSERASYLQYFFLLVCFVGVIIIKGIDDASTNLSMTHLLLGIGAAVLSALAYNMVRYLRATEEPMVIIFYFPLVTIPFVGVYCLFYWTPITLKDVLPLIGVGVFTQLAQYFMTKAYHLREIHELAIYRYLSLPIAILTGLILFNESLPLNVYIGIGLIFIALLASAIIRGQRHKSS